MQTISFDFKFSHIRQNFNTQTKISEGIETLGALPFVKEMACYQAHRAIVQKIPQHTNSLIIVVGIGGSSLGAMAIISALNKNSPADFYCADTVDTDHLALIQEKMQQAQNAQRPIFILIISKSGTTLETLANGQVLLSILQKYKPENWHKYCIFITDKHSPLWNIGLKLNSPTVEIPADVGGRFSVFSAAGLIPCHMMGIDTTQLIQGAQDMTSICQQPVEKNPAALTALALYTNYFNGFTIHDTFIFSVLLEKYGAWYRQLLAESIGKKHDTNGKLVHYGLTPTTSLGTSDLHSVGQLNIAGPKNKYTTFITLEKHHTEIEIPKGVLAPHLAHHKLSALMRACAQGTMDVYQQEELPFNSVHLAKLNAYSLGSLMQHNMLMIVLLGRLFAINTFDQPEVEQYKIRARKALNL